MQFDANLLAGQLAPRSLKMYQRDFAAYLCFASGFDVGLRPETLQRWVRELVDHSDKSPNTINRMISAVKSVMRAAAAHGHIDQATAYRFDQIGLVRNDLLRTRLRTNAHVRIQADELGAISDTVDTAELIGLRDRAILAVIASGALRVSELTGLTVEQIRRKGMGHVVNICSREDGEYREAPLGEEAITFVEAWLRARPVNSPYVFAAFDGRGNRTTGRPLSAVAVWKLVRKYGAQAGLTNIKPRDFQRFLGTQLSRTDIHMAQKALEHKRIETTARHYVLDESDPELTDIP
jgi:integrase/recombinase XerD